jgi:chemotaxis protein methyltransferase CheR
VTATKHSGGDADRDLDAIIQHVTDTTGLALSPTQRQHLEQYAGRRRGGDVIASLADPAEFRALIDLLTVQETFFFRYEAQFDAFRDSLLPRFLARARDERRKVRLWSAGCCTGEEAYTLALIAADCGCLDEVEILATDINETYLEAAMNGVYSPRSVARVPPAALATYFTAAKDRHRLDERIRAHVAFKWLNLADASYPSFLNGTSSLDMIFCRNVLIYFDRARIRGIIERLGSCLNSNGVLALGHSEMLPREWPLQVRQVGEAFFYGAAVAAPEPVVAPAPVIGAADDAAKRTPQADDAGSAAPGPARSVAEMLDEVEQLANDGKPRQAAQLCRDVIALDASRERGHYLLGLLSLDTPAEALEHFQRAVRLEPAHLPARLHLAECAERIGRRSEALLEYRTLERLARARPPGEVLDPLEGITYGMLALIGESARRRLE